MKKSSLQITRRVLQYARPFWPHLTGLFLLSLLATPIALLKPYTMKLLIDSGFGSQPLPSVIKAFFPENYQFTFSSVLLIVVVIAISLAVIDNLYGFVSWLYSTYTGEKLVLNFRTLVFDHVQRLSLAYHDTKGVSDSLYRIQYDTQCVRSFLMGQLTSLISSFITLVAMVVVMFSINGRFAIIALCIMPPLIYLTKLSSQKLRGDWYLVKDAESGAVGVINEVLSALRIVKAFGQEDNENRRFSNQAENVVKGQMRMAKLGAGYSFLNSMLLAGASTLFLYLGALNVHENKMTLGELTLVLAYLSQVFWPLQSIIKNWNELQSSVTSLDRIISVLDLEKEVKEKANAIHLPTVKGAFKFEKVAFAYEIGKPTLKNISFEIKPGDRVGIMGTTGAGKTTLVSLLSRFYDPASGKIFIDGHDITNFKLADYRKQFSLVLQDPILFSTTIKENIRYGRPQATDEEIIEAAKAANAHNFIMKKGGYDIEVGERGMQLSGGERQRISLARAFIKNAPVLILDEPTSSLDIKTEVLIMQAMERLMEGRTTFMITHRLDTLNSCNIILHLENGELEEVVRGQNSEFIEKKKMAFLNDA